MNALHLTALICSHLCHDLVSPVGAINNGIEMLAEEDDPDMREQALEMMAHSASEAAGRLLFFRLAFGAAGGMGEEIRIEEAIKAANGMFRAGRIKLDWPVAEPAIAPKAVVKLLMNLVLIGSQALVRGGDLRVSLSGGGGRHDLRVVAEGTGARLDPDKLAAATQDVDLDGLDSRSAQAYMARLLAADLGAKVTIASDENRVEISSETIA